MLLVALAGLPGSGKSALARALAPLLRAPVLDKDRVRDALFGPDHVAYTPEQDDLCVDATYRAALWLAREGEVPAAILDGRTYSRRAQVEALRAFAARERLALALIECVCTPELARARLAADSQRGQHPAADRGPALHDRLAASREPIERPDLVLDTGTAEPEQLAELVKAKLLARPPRPWTADFPS